MCFNIGLGYLGKFCFYRIQIYLQDTDYLPWMAWASIFLKTSGLMGLGYINSESENFLAVEELKNVSYNFYCCLPHIYLILFHYLHLQIAAALP